MKQYEDVEYREGETLKDGQRIHIDLQVCDSLQRAIATDPEMCQGRGQRPARALTLLEPIAARKWLEEKLGPLAWFEVEGSRAAGAG